MVGRPTLGAPCFPDVDARPLELGGILLTHAHTGHYTGLLQLGKEGADARNVPVRRINHPNVLLKNAEQGRWSKGAVQTDRAGRLALVCHEGKVPTHPSIHPSTHPLPQPPTYPPIPRDRPKMAVFVYWTRTSCSRESRCSAPRRWHLS